MTQRRTPVATFLELGAGMAVFGSGTPVSKLVTAGFPVFIACGLRVAIAALVLLPFVIAERESVRELRSRDWLIVTLIALIGMFGFSVFMLYGMKQVSGVAGSIVMSTTPAVTALASFVFLRDRLGWTKSAAIALAVLGVLILNLGGADAAASGGNLLLGTMLVFGAVCSEAAYTLLGKKASERVSPVMIAGLAAALAIPLFLPFALFELDTFVPADLSVADWLGLVWWGAGTLALGTVLWYAGVANAAGSTAAGFMGIMPVSALLLSYALLGEPFAWIHIAGFATVFAGVVLIIREHARG